MPEVFSSPILNEIFAFAGPLLIIAAVCWFLSRTERVVNYMFPYLEWERSLGSFNIKAEKRANTAIRWVKFGIYIMLVDALFGILWGAKGLPMLHDWSDPWVMGELALRMPALGFCLGLWVFYIGGYLIPRVRAERDRAAWLKMRRENEAEDEAHRARGEVTPKSRVHAPLRKPRANAPLGLQKKVAPQKPAPLYRSRKSLGPGG